MHSWAKKRQFHVTSKLNTNLITVAAAVLLAAVSVAAILVWAGVIERQPTPATVATATVATATVTTATVAPEVVTRTAPGSSAFAWFDVASWESSGNDVSPLFHIEAGIWRVMWVTPHDSAGDGSFAIDVYNGDGTYALDLYDTADNVGIEFGGALRGTLGVRGAGDYFLQIRTARDYEVTVQEQP